MKNKNQSGITLVALVVTIIILLILAGVTISQISGDKGLFSRVRKAVGEYENAQKEEEIEISKLEKLLTEVREKLQPITAKPEEVLKEKTYYDEELTLQTGKMEKYTDTDKKLKSGETYEILEGYHSENAVITGPSLHILPVNNGIYSGSSDNSICTYDIKALLPDKYSELTKDNFFMDIKSILVNNMGGISGLKTKEITKNYNSTSGILTIPGTAPNVSNSWQYGASYQLYCIYVD